MRCDFAVILITCASKSEAKNIADSLLKDKLIACANLISGIESRFWWKGKVDNAREVLIVAKARRRNFKKIEKNVKRLHSYDVPEIIALPIIEGSRQYLKWISDSACA